MSELISKNDTREAVIIPNILQTNITPYNEQWHQKQKNFNHSAYEYFNNAKREYEMRKG